MCFECLRLYHLVTHGILIIIVWTHIVVFILERNSLHENVRQLIDYHVKQPDQVAPVLPHVTNHFIMISVDFSF